MPEKDYIDSTDRIEAFSDGVIAIILTLLILEIKVPHLSDFSNQAVFAALIVLAPKFVGFVLSFVTIAIFWVNHHHFFHEIKYTDKWLLWYNNFLLFWLAVIPFVTAFIGDYPSVPAVVALYGFVFFMGAGAFTLMGHYVFFRSRLIPSETVPHSVRKSEFKRSLVGVALYGSSILLAFVSIYISIAIFIFLPIFYFFPRHIADHAHEGER